MKDMKKLVAAQLEDLTEDILTLTGCLGFWGEPELPDCMRVQMESEKEYISTALYLISIPNTGLFL